MSLPAQRPAHLGFALSLADSSPDWAVRLEKPAGCLATIPRSSMHRVPVYLEATLAERNDSVLTLQTDLLAQDVANEFRALLGAKGEEVPTADTNFVWYSVPTELVVIAYRNGDMTARARTSTGDSAATLFLIRAFNAARAHGTATLFWPDGLKADSLLVRLSLLPAYVGDELGEDVAFDEGTKFAAFYLTEPERSSPFPLPNQQPPTYPHENAWQGPFDGFVVLQFVIDTTGRAEANTIRDLWPAGKARLHGENRAAYDEFVRTLRVWEKYLRFSPARLGACAIEQQVRHPIVFKIVARR